MRHSIKRTRSKRFFRVGNKRLWVLVGLLLVGAVIAALEFSGTTNLFSKDTTPATTGNSQTKGEPAGEAQQSEQSEEDAVREPGNEKTTPGGSGNSTPNVTLLEPSGPFVNNHRPKLDGSATESQMQSVCNTTPGASCQISFTKDGTTRTLPAQTTDSGGATYWSWKLQDIGLTEGSWQVKATATLNGQTKEASDALNLEIGS